MEFVGELNDKLKGFYRSSYTEEGVEKYYHIFLNNRNDCIIYLFSIECRWQDFGSYPNGADGRPPCVPLFRWAQHEGYFLCHVGSSPGHEISVQHASNEQHRNASHLFNLWFIFLALITFSNIIIKRDGMKDFFWDHFEKSVPMSTYLVAFVVADFAKIESDVYNSKWGFNIYARHSARNQTGYIRSMAICLFERSI